MLPVLAPNWHTYPDPHLGSWNCLPHQAHIALSEPMSSTDKQGSSLGSFPTSPPLYPHFNRVRAFDLVSRRVWWEAVANTRHALCESPGNCSGLRFGAWPWKRNNGRLGPIIRHLVSTRLPSCGRAAFLSPSPPCTALDHAYSLSRKLAYVPGPTFRFVKLLASSGSHCTK